ncbi:unnamed protein product (macronuclear) [Paramecium tetraurelia]|uniref:Chromosome undetermined scaffold_1, whole genome shotgun sequence n=1 Tax=Paramecium tetraurelia TaxID=5888 RepID=Q6BFE2_PARTE|nr:hypothetical protein [Paramecium tetraurelia strain d4-2]XP_001423004.1 uncharacterized protein GSPATT00000041001 [Paramecium tetraurelia]CAH03629.1 hypothetical protein PTMB.429c [Paramecium tetraurelia]CAK55606.1 unnamed protein product [Paramecium tetraurelia]|eukprot:XP_001423004.1 hypothetical protein (macronuclear) [Paramecium tetraurelia strain d4-2]
MKNQDEKKLQLDRIGTASTMAQTGQQSHFQQQLQCEFIQPAFGKKKKEQNYKINNRYQKQDMNDDPVDQDQQICDNQNQQKIQQFQQIDLQTKQKKAKDDENQKLIKFNEDQYNDGNQYSEPDQNQESPVMKPKKIKGDHLYITCQIKSFAEFLVKYQLQDIAHPYITKNTKTKCCIFTVNTKQSLYQTQKQNIIKVGQLLYDDDNEDHCNLLYSIFYLIFQLEKLSKLKSQEISNNKINLFQLLYTLSCVTLFGDDIFQIGKFDKEQIISNMFFCSKYIFQGLKNGILDPIFKNTESKGETFHNLMTCIHMGVFRCISISNCTQEQEIFKNLENKSVKFLLDDWKKNKFKNN